MWLAGIDWNFLVKMKIITLAFVLGAVFAIKTANADPTISFSGALDSQLGVRNQSKNYRFDYPQVKTGFSRSTLYEAAVVNDTRLQVDFGNQTEEGLDLGAVIILNADTSQNKFSNSDYNEQGFETYAFAENDFGRLEGGNTTGVYEALKVSGANVARAAGGIDGDVKYWWNPYIYRDGTVVKSSGGKIYSTNSSPERLVEKHFIQSPNLPSNYDEGGEATAAKISYITPEIEGFRFGLSYIEDIAQFGSASRIHKTAKRMPNLGVASLGFKEIYSGVIQYNDKFDETTVLFSLAGEVGTSKYVKDPNNFSRYFKRHPLRAWEVGAGAEDSGFKIAGSYGSWGRSGEIKRLINNSCKKSDYWTLGGSYEDDYTGFSVTYFGSRRCGIDAILGYDFITDGADAIYNLVVGNRALTKSKALEILSFGIDTKMAPGFMPYGEISFFRMNERNGPATTAEVPTGSVNLRNDAAHNKQNVGYVIMSGVKLQF